MTTRDYLKYQGLEVNKERTGSTVEIGLEIFYVHFTML